MWQVEGAERKPGHVPDERHGGVLQQRTEGEGEVGRQRATVQEFPVLTPVEIQPTICMFGNMH